LNAAPPADSTVPSSSQDRLVGAALTQKQQVTYDMKVAGKTLKEIAHILGISRPVVSKTLGACYKKLGIRKKDRLRGTVLTNPELAAAAIDAAADPTAFTAQQAIDRVNEQLKAAGLPAKVNHALIRRLRVKYANAVMATRELRTTEILEMLGKKIDLAAFYLDDKVMAEASARDIMLGLGVLIEKRNLLRGEPTAIVSDHERKKLHELLPLMIAEAQRRGITVDGQVTSKEVTAA